MLSNRILTASVLTPVPMDDDKEHWDWYQREIVYRGGDFRFKIGAFVYCIPAPSLSQLDTIYNSLTKDNIFRCLASFAKPANRFAILADNLGVSLYNLLINNVVADVASGIISEYLNFATAKKKKILAINPKGTIRRDQTKQSTSSQSGLSVKEQILRMSATEKQDTT